MRRGTVSKVVGALLVFGIGILPETVDGASDPTAALRIQQGTDLHLAGEMAGALASFILAAEIDPMLAAALAAGQIAFEMGDDAAAARYAETALARRPGHREATRLRAAIREQSAAGMGASTHRTGGSGFAEFGPAALAGLLFIFAVSMHDIGQTPPVSEASEKEDVAAGTLFPFYRMRVAEKEAQEVPHEWIEAA